PLVSAMGDGWEAAAELEFSAQFPLHAACKSGSAELLRSRLQSHYQHLLLEDPVHQWTPSHWAAYCGHMDCLTVINQVESLFDHPLTRSLQTPLHLACFAGQFMTAKWLLQRGAVIGKEDYMGETPLHKAARNGSLDCVQLLLSQGANRGTRSHSGLTPLDVAQMQRHESCVEALQRNSSSNEAASSCESLLLPPGVQQTLKRCHDNGSFDPVVAKRPRCSDEWRLLEAEQQAEAGPAPLRTYQQVASCSISGWHFM
ncbi:hypothetical protein BOX15_Mlig008435g2, partial [Macrostomum lignano]